MEYSLSASGVYQLPENGEILPVFKNIFESARFQAPVRNKNCRGSTRRRSAVIMATARDPGKNPPLPTAGDVANSGETKAEEYLFTPAV